jgi:hypothetical protein
MNYCVCCGVLLREENRAGIVCRACEQRQRARRGPERDQPVSVCYCWRCGKRYRPADHSIAHPACHLSLRERRVLLRLCFRLLS